MPELPEVEIIRNYFEETSMHQEIVNLAVQNSKVLDGPEEELRKVLIGDQFVTTKRWGKNLFLGTAKHQTVLMHFGMTGSLEYYSATIETPKYARVMISFRNGFQLAYISKRMFGRLGLVPNLEHYIESKGLAHDAMEISLDQFTANVKRRKKNVKAVLLDQGTAAGIGNWIADEILYQARIHPTSPSQNLTEDHLLLLYERMQEILQVALDVEAVREDLPAHYITHYGRNTTIDCPSCKNPIEKTVIGGRGTYACERCQNIL